MIEEICFFPRGKVAGNDWGAREENGSLYLVRGLGRGGRGGEHGIFDTGLFDSRCCCSGGCEALQAEAEEACLTNARGWF